MTQFSPITIIYIVITMEQFEGGCFIIHKIVVCVCSQNARLACSASTVAEPATVNTACHVTASVANVSARSATPGRSAQTVSITVMAYSSKKTGPALII